MTIFTRIMRLFFQTLSRRAVYAFLLLLGLIGIFSSMRSTTAQQASRPAPARGRGEITVQPQARSATDLHLSDGREMRTEYAGAVEGIELLRLEQAQLLALASADLDEDGVPDLISGYATAGRGVITLLRGNVDAIYPNSPEAKGRRAAGTFTGAPFLSPALAYAAPEPPEFLGAGDFDGDGHFDVAAAARGGDRLLLFSGDGKGGLRPADEIHLPGRVTAMTTGEMNRRDGLEDIVVAVETGAGALALIYESSRGGPHAPASIVPFSARIGALALGQLDDDPAQDLAVAAGNELWIVPGSLRPPAPSLPPILLRHSFPSLVRSLALGSFTDPRKVEIAVLSEDGAVYALSPREADPGRADEPARIVEATWPQAAGLVRTSVSGRAGDDLMVIDARHRQVHILTGQARETGADSAASSRSNEAHVTFDVKGEPVAALPMRLNTDARSDLVIGINGRRFVSVMATTPAAVFTVNSTGDGSDANPTDGLCNDGTGACTLRAAIEQANVSPGADAINFNIPGGGAQTIVPASVVYEIDESVTIDGATQPGFAGQPLIELKGGGATSGSGMIIAAANCVVRGIRINGFGANGIHVVNSSGHLIEGNVLGLDAAAGAAARNGGHGIEVATSSNVTIGGTVAAARNIISGNARTGVSLQAGASGNRLQGNYIGTNAAGAAAIPNGCGPCLEGGILIDESPDNVIGGATAGAGNVISGNNGDGIGIWESASIGNQIFGNFIGVAANGATPLGNNANAGPNTGGGVVIRNFSSNNQIGGNAASQGNIIANNIPYGISVYSGQGNAIQGNSIYANAGGSATEGLGIDLGGDGLTPNDGGDADAGPNDLQNFATLSSATLIASGGVFAQGSLNARPGAQYVVEFFYSPTCDPSGNGEGEMFLDRIPVTTDNAGLASFSASLYANILASGVITSLVIDSEGNTSEFSPCIPLSIPQGPNVQPENVLVLPDLITAVGTGFGGGSGTVSMLVNGVGFDQSAKVEDQGRRVTQAGQLVSPVNGSRTIDGAVQPNKPVTITFINAAGGATSVPFTRPPLPQPPPNPPLALTNVTRSGGFINITGELTAEPNTLYVIYFRLTPVVEAPVAPGGCPAREEPKSFLGSIEVRTDGNGKASFGSPAPVTFPEPPNGGTGIVSAYAVPFDVVEGQKKPSKTKKVIDSNCAGLSPSSGSGVHLIQEITVTSNDITAIGFGFAEGVEVFVDDVGFEKKATVTGQLRMTVKQDGRLKNGKTIAEAVPEGVVVRIRFRNPDGGFTEVGFRR